MEVLEALVHVCCDRVGVASGERCQVGDNDSGWIGGYPQTSRAVAYIPWSYENSMVLPSGSFTMQM